jgi:carboxyl-terminal processing protease
LLDLVETELGYATIEDHYYRRVPTQQLLDGARSGLEGYLRRRGVQAPEVGAIRARPDGRGAVPAIEQQIGRIVVRYGDRVSPRELVYGAIRGELGALHDPYSVLFTKTELAGFTRAIEGTAFGGVGIVFVHDDAAHAWRVERLFEDGPAERAGVRPGDLLTAIDGKPAGELAGDALTAALRGPAGSVVQLALVRDGAPLAQPLAVRRAVITPPNATVQPVGDVAYAALHRFDLGAAAALRRGIARAGNVRAVILDLRGNGGGYEQAAVEVASLFVPHGPVVVLEGERGKRRTLLTVGTPLPARPLIVLVDHDSASASELVAGAIRDRGAGQLVGTTTFGKGLVQTMFPLPDGAAIKLTTSRYLTPAGHDIDRIGLTPDVVVARPADAAIGTPGRDPQLDRALALLAPEQRPASATPTAP